MPFPTDTQTLRSEDCVSMMKLDRPTLLRVELRDPQGGGRGARKQIGRAGYEGLGGEDYGGLVGRGGFGVGGKQEMMRETGAVDEEQEGVAGGVGDVEVTAEGFGRGEEEYAKG
jgi:hypothetical protein